MYVNSNVIINNTEVSNLSGNIGVFINADKDTNIIIKNSIVKNIAGE